MCLHHRQQHAVALTTTLPCYRPTWAAGVRTGHTHYPRSGRCPQMGFSSCRLQVQCAGLQVSSCGKYAKTIFFLCNCSESSYSYFQPYTGAQATAGEYLNPEMCRKADSLEGPYIIIIIIGRHPRGDENLISISAYRHLDGSGRLNPPHLHNTNKTPDLR